MRRAALARFVYGVVLLVASERLAWTVAGESASHVHEIGCMLGVRHVLQALTVDRRGSRSWLAVGVVIDVLHALSMIVLAVLSSDHRRLAVLDAVVAGIWATSGWRTIRRS